MKVSVVGVERTKDVGRTLWVLKEFYPYLKGKVDTWGGIGRGQEEIQFHSVGCGTQRCTRKGVLGLLVLASVQSLVSNLTQSQMSSDSF